MSRANRKFDLEKFFVALSEDREMRQDRARLVKICCASTLPVTLQGAPVPIKLLASLAGPA